MFQEIEKKKKIQAWRLRLLGEIASQLKAYQVLGTEDILEFAKELGRDSEKLKKVLAGMK